MANPDVSKNRIEKVSSDPRYIDAIDFVEILNDYLGLEDTAPEEVVTQENPYIEDLMSFASKLGKQDGQKTPLSAPDLKHLRNVSYESDGVMLHYERENKMEYEKLNLLLKKEEKVFKALFWRMESAGAAQRREQSADVGAGLVADSLNPDVSVADIAVDVASGLTEEVEEDVETRIIVEADDLLKREIELEGIMDDLKEAAPEKVESLVLDGRRKIVALRFLIKELRVNEVIELVQKKDGVQEIYFENKGAKPETVNVSDLEETINLVEEEFMNLDNGKIYRELEKVKNTIRPKDFLKWRAEGRFEDMLKVISNIKSWDELQKEKLVVFDFGKNSALEYQVGIGDVVPPKIRKLSVNGQLYTRRGNQGFYTKAGKYLAIFDGSRVKIEEVDENYFAKAEVEYERAFGSEYEVSDEKIDGKEITKKTILEVAKDFKVDAYLLEVLLNVIGVDEENRISEVYEFVHMAARYVQNAEAKFTLEEKKNSKADSGNYYSQEFLFYAMDRFNLFTIYSGRNTKGISIVKKYGELRGVSEYEFSEEKEQEVSKMRDEERGRNWNEVRDYERDSGKRYAGTKYYSPEEVVTRRPGRKKRLESYLQKKRKELEADPKMTLEKVNYRLNEERGAWLKEDNQKDGVERLNVLRKNLESRGLSPEKIAYTMQQAEIVYRNMSVRQGEFYKDKVVIEKRKRGKNDGESYGTWSITNSCVGHTMKVLEDTDFWLNGSRQKGKHAGNFVWAKMNGQRDSWYEGLLGDQEKGGVEFVENIHPNTIDEEVGKNLMGGEPAVASLWNHVFWIYKTDDGRVMINHSGVDVRPKRIAADSVVEAPPGYDLQGAFYVRRKGSKVNELPLSEFLAKKNKYFSSEIRSKGLDFLKFVPLSKLVDVNATPEALAAALKISQEKEGENKLAGVNFEKAKEAADEMKNSQEQVQAAQAKVGEITNS